VATYADSTQRTQYATLSSVLHLFADKPAYKKTYNYWLNKKVEASKEMPDPNEKTEKQAENWLDWSEVQKKKSELSEEVSPYLLSKKKLTSQQLDKMLGLLVLSLYTDIAPRRNQDYTAMVVVKKLPKEASTDKNYYDIATKKFVFNKYKTAKKYGQQIVDVPEPLATIIKQWVKHSGKAKENEVALLGDLNPVNGITRLLNKLFDKKVGSSMLRHIFLTDKLGEAHKENKALADSMAHTMRQQRDYIKTD
jgi:hypothetical protein